MTSFGQRVFRGIVWNQVGLIAQASLSILFSILVARGLGVVNYGLYATALNLVMVLLFLIELGFESTLDTFVPRLLHGEQPSQASYLLQRLLLLRLGATGLLAVGVYFMAEPISRLLGQVEQENLTGYLHAALLYLICNSVANLLRRFFGARLQQKIPAIIEFGRGGLLLGLASGTLWLGLGVTGVLWATGIAEAVACGILLFQARSFLCTPATPVDLKPLLRFGLVAYLTQSLRHLLQRRIHILMLAYFLDDVRPISYYNLTASLVERAAFIGSQMRGVALPSFAEAVHRGGLVQLRSVWRNFFQLQLLLRLPCQAFLFWVAGPIVLVLYGAEYAPAIPLVRLMVLAESLSLALGGSIGDETFYALKRPLYPLVIHSLNGPLNVGLNVFLIPPYGALGAVLGGCLSKLAGYGLCLIPLVRLRAIHYPVDFVAKLSLAWLGAGLLAWLVGKGDLITLLLAGLVFFPLFFGLLHLLRPLSPTDRQLLSRVHPLLGRIAAAF